MKILDIGCGNSKYLAKNAKEMVIGLDSSKLPGVDIVQNLDKTPLPFKKDEFDMIIASHVLEHISNFVPLIKEMWRITKNKGLIKIKTPFYSSWGQFNDPTHVRSFTPFTFDYFIGKNNYSHEVKKENEFNFSIKKLRIHFGVGKSKKFNWLFDPIINLNKKFYCRFFAWIFPAAEIEYELIVLK